MMARLPARNSIGRNLSNFGEHDQAAEMLYQMLNQVWLLGESCCVFLKLEAFAVTDLPTAQEPFLAQGKLKMRRVPPTIYRGKRSVVAVNPIKALP